MSYALGYTYVILEYFRFVSHLQDTFYSFKTKIIGARLRILKCLLHVGRSNDSAKNWSYMYVYVRTCIFGEKILFFFFAVFTLKFHR